MRYLAGVLVLLISWPFALPAMAELNYHPVRLDDGTEVLVVAGEFEFDESYEPFLAAVRDQDSDLVMFDSPGGNPVSAMRLGRLIRGQNLPTMQSRQFQCDSACALAFFGGALRYAEPGAIGVHKTSFAADTVLDRDGAVSAVQSLTAEIISYLVEMGIDPALLKLALTYESNDMRYLSTSEMIEFGVLYFGPESQLPSVAMAPDEPSDQPQAPQPEPPATAAMGSQQAMDFVTMLIETHMLPSFQAISTLRERYSEIVDYYGEPVSLADVMDDKRNYFNRWPLRSYEIIPDSVRADCLNGQTCRVTGIYRWAVISVERNKKAAGTASFEYAFTARPPYRVLKETSEVIERH